DEVSRVQGGTRLAAPGGMAWKLALALTLACGAAPAVAGGDLLGPASDPEPELSPRPDPAPLCGNGVVDPGEICDDGNTTSGDGCSSTCSIDNYPPKAAECGDGNLDEGEECDDGNTEDGDGCTATCDYEA